MAKARISGRMSTSTKVRKRCSSYRGLNLKCLSVAEFYSILFDAIVSGKQPASGRDGFYFLESGEYRQLNAVEAIAKALFAQGKVVSPEAVRLTQADLGPGQDKNFNSYLVGMGTNSRARGERSRQLGWKPTKTTDDFYANIPADVEYVLKNTGSSSR